MIWSCVAGAALVAGGPGTVCGTPMVFSAADATRHATATFDVLGGEVLIILANASTADVLVPTDVLTAVFFDIRSAQPMVLVPVSAVIGPTSTVLFGGTDPGGAVGGEWAFRQGLVGAPAGAEYGVGSSGLGLFAPQDLFPGSNLQGPRAVGGLQYGITSAGDDPSTGNRAVTGASALIRNEVIFRLSGAPAWLDPAEHIRNVVFQYGTSLPEPTIPEPATLMLLGIGTLALQRRRPVNL